MEEYKKNIADLLEVDSVEENEYFESFGISHPFGKDFYGLLNYIPTQYDRETMVEALSKIPAKLCNESFLHGTPDEIISKLEEYAKVGLKHIVLYNITYNCDISKVKSSFGCIKKVLEYFKK